MEKLKNFFLAEKEKSNDNESGNSSWVWTIIVSAVGMMTLAYFYFRSWRNGRELAKLRHEKDHLEQLRMVDKILKVVKGNEALVNILEENIQELDVEIAELDKKILATEDKYAKHKQDIDAIKSWDDVDRYSGASKP